MMLFYSRGQAFPLYNSHKFKFLRLL
jgi:hypothetical protein